MITIIDYGLGNPASIKNMLKKIGVNALITSRAEEIKIATKLILPGVGNFKEGIKNINYSGFREILNIKVLDEKTPILGICLGMQLMTLRSEEGNEEGLGWINAETVEFHFNNKVNPKIPHFGWNYVMSKGENRILVNYDMIPRFYFVHSYHVNCMDEDLEIGKTKYGIEFSSVINKNNIYGVQFHPEKSHKYGMQLLKNFAEIEWN